MIARLHYITQNLLHITHAAQAQKACAGNVKWVQLRVKDTHEKEWLRIAQETKNICDTFNAVCIVNDNVMIAHTINAHGVHLGKNDMHPDNARHILGDSKIIGASANSIDDIIKLSQTTVNYIGIGPFRFTQTKTNLNTILGLNSLIKIIKEANALNISIPIIAIGGIILNDIDTLLNTGVHGIAVSSSINLSANITQTASTFIQKLQSLGTITHS